MKNNSAENDEINYKEILKEYKDYIYFNTRTMTEAEYWKKKYYGEC